MIMSARRAAMWNMHVARQDGSRTGASEVPWPSAFRRWSRAALDLLGSPGGMASSALALPAAMTAIAYCVRASAGFRLANSAFLATLWQVQAAAVSLALALAVFVFGLFPRSGKRISYRTFLRRSLAKPIITAGIASLLFDGIVLLGVGHQVPDSPGASDGHGWAVTLACVVGLGSIGSIALLFGRTIGAIDPVAGSEALAKDRNTVIGDALRTELLDAFTLDVLENSAEPLNYRCHPYLRAPGRQPVFSTRSGVTVRDVNLRKLAAIGRRARHANRSLPVVHVEPGQAVKESIPMASIDVATPRLDRHRARRAVRLGPERDADFRELLDSVHAEALEHIRAGRPIEAAAAMKTMTDMLELAWQAHLAHARNSSAADGARRRLVGRIGLTDKITDRLTALVRAGAVSSDEQIRKFTARYPRDAAVIALQARASTSVLACLTLYCRMYEAVVSDVTEAGRLALPAHGLGRQRIVQLFEALRYFAELDLAEPLTRLARAHAEPRGHDGVRFARREHDDALFAMDHAYAANNVILAMLHKAVEYNDIVTVRSVVPIWRTPEAEWFLDELKYSAAGLHDEAAAEELEQALDAQRRALAGMKLRLLVSALRAEAQNTSGADPDGRDPIVAAVLESLRPESFWPGLSAAAEQTDEAFFPEPRDDEIQPIGMTVSNFPDPQAALARAFVRAALVRPDLREGGEPDPQYANDHATVFTDAASSVATHLPWARRYGAPEGLEKLAADLTARMERAASIARRSAAREVLTLEVAEPEALQTLVAQGYAEQEIISGLFSWALLQPVVEERYTGRPLTLTWRIDRREVPGGVPEKLADTATDLAREIGHASVGRLAASVSNAAPVRAVAPQRLEYRVNLAIAALRCSRSAQSARDGAGIVVLAPSQPRIADLLNLADRDRHEPATATGEPSPRARMLTQLGFDTPQRRWLLLGTTDGVPVLRAPSINTLIILDLASGIEWRTGGLGGHAGEPLTVMLTPESEDSARALLSPQTPDLADATGQAPLRPEDEDRITANMTTVVIKVELALAFAATAGTRIRVLEIAES
jgi:hypothetical protein